MKLLTRVGFLFSLFISLLCVHVFLLLPNDHLKFFETATILNVFLHLFGVTIIMMKE